MILTVWVLIGLGIFALFSEPYSTLGDYGIPADQHELVMHITAMCSFSTALILAGMLKAVDAIKGDQ
jgi:hypothetical protein